MRVKVRDLNTSKVLRDVKVGKTTDWETDILVPICDEDPEKKFDIITEFLHVVPEDLTAESEIEIDSDVEANPNPTKQKKMKYSHAQQRLRKKMRAMIERSVKADQAEDDEVAALCCVCYVV